MSKPEHAAQIQSIWENLRDKKMEVCEWGTSYSPDGKYIVIRTWYQYSVPGGINTLVGSDFHVLRIANSFKKLYSYYANECYNDAINNNGEICLTQPFEWLVIQKGKECGHGYLVGSDVRTTSAPSDFIINAGIATYTLKRKRDKFVIGSIVLPSEPKLHPAYIPDAIIFSDLNRHQRKLFVQMLDAVGLMAEETLKHNRKHEGAAIILDYKKEALSLFENYEPDPKAEVFELPRLKEKLMAMQKR